MSQRESGYERIERDLYETPAWVTECLLPHLPDNMKIWEPASASGKMARVLIEGGHAVSVSDISHELSVDFLKTNPDEAFDGEAIITNPPYEFAREFIEHALEHTETQSGMVAMLLRTDFDHAKTRQHLFSMHKAFAKKIVLTKRIVWFDGPGATPSFNHAWYIWDWKNQFPPVISYGPATFPK